MRIANANPKPAESIPVTIQMPKGIAPKFGTDPEAIDRRVIELGAPVLLDEKEARKVAKEKGLIVIGTVGLIERAAQLNLLDLGQTLGAPLLVLPCKRTSKNMSTLTNRNMSPKRPAYSDPFGVFFP
jgi:hypothetical protein